MDFLKIVSLLKNFSKLGIVLLIGIVIGMSIIFINVKNAQTEFGKKEISLVENQLAWVPESGEILLLDRKEKYLIKGIISKDAGLAIVSMILASAQQEVASKPINNLTKKQSSTNSTTPK